MSEIEKFIFVVAVASGILLPIPLKARAAWQTSGSSVYVPAGASLGIAVRSPTHDLSATGLIDWGNNVRNLSCDGSGNIFVNSGKGIAWLRTLARHSDSPLPAGTLESRVTYPL